MAGANESPTITGRRYDCSRDLRRLNISTLLPRTGEESRCLVMGSGAIRRLDPGLLGLFLQVLEQLDTYPTLREAGCDLQLATHGFHETP